jgi:preprotein translocase subunit YajC
MQQYFPLILIVLAVLLLFVLPSRQRKRVAAQAQTLQASLVPGTPVMTTSGIHGTIARLGEGTVDLEIAPGVVATFERRAILQVREPVVDTPAAPEIAPEGESGGPGDDTPGAPGGPAGRAY